jgi:ankyrin repeat protein
LKQILLFLLAHSIVFFTAAMSFNKACLCDDINEVKIQLLSNQNILDQGFDNDGLLPVHYAAHGGATRVLEFLLDKKPSLIDAVDAQGDILLTQLFAAIPIWRKEVLNLKTMQACLNFQIVRCNGKPDFNIFNKYESKFKDIIQLLISRKVNLSIKNKFGLLWFQMPGIDEEFSTYVYELLIQEFNKQID